VTDFIVTIENEDGIIEREFEGTRWTRSSGNVFIYDAPPESDTDPVAEIDRESFISIEEA